MIKSFITYYTNESEINDFINSIWEEFLKIELDWKNISCKNDLIKIFCNFLNIKNIAYNWDFLEEIINDTFWNKYLIIILKNKDNLFFNDENDENISIFYNILIDLISEEKKAIFIKK